MGLLSEKHENISVQAGMLNMNDIEVPTITTRLLEFLGNLV
jgi:hypothetical protein